MANKAKIKFIILASIILLSISLCACADPTIQTREVSIGLPVRDSYPIKMEGTFPVAKSSVYSGYSYYEILPNQFEDFLTFLEGRKYYRGKIILDDTSKLFTREIEYFKSQDECLWFSHGGSVWVGKKYTEKFFYIAQVNSSFFKRDNDGKRFSGKLSHFLFSDTPLNSSTFLEVETEYSTSLSWDEIKNLYYEYQIDEENHSILIDCDIYDNEEDPYLHELGYTTLVYNEENSTIKILDEYIKK